MPFGQTGFYEFGMIWESQFGQQFGFLAKKNY
jgi:hypothetical protein